MITAIRITGQIGLNSDVVETFNRLRMQKKYTCVLIKDSKEVLGMLRKVKDFIAFGELDEATLVELLKARGKIIGDSKGKVKDAEKVAKELIGGKKLEELGIKPYFGLHPARGGLNTKLHYPRGVLGNHKEKINELIRRML